MSERTLEGRVAVVTGGGRGIGAAIAHRLAREGAAVALVARSKAEIEAVAAAITAAGGRAAALPCDVTDEAAVVALTEAVERLLGPVDILAHSAGAAASAPFAKITLADWQAMWTQNATSAFLCARAFAPNMAGRGWGRLVFVASIAGLVGAKYVTHYTAAKHAVVGLVRALAVELADSGVTVNAVCPGYVASAMTERTLENVGRRAGLGRAEALAAVLTSADQGRLIEPEEVADEVAALCHPEASAVNGQAIVLQPRSTRS